MPQKLQTFKQMQCSVLQIRPKAAITLVTVQHWIRGLGVRFGGL